MKPVLTGQEFGSGWDKRSRSRLTLSVIVTELVIGLAMAQAAEKSLWQIGKPDHASRSSIRSRTSLKGTIRASGYRCFEVTPSEPPAAATDLPLANVFVNEL
jgi:hypothetical protein